MFQTSGARRGPRTAKWWANSKEKQIEFEQPQKVLSKWTCGGTYSNLVHRRQHNKRSDENISMAVMAFARCANSDACEIQRFMEVFG
jgi:predicted metal-binding protein